MAGLPLSALTKHINNIADATKRGTALAVLEATEIAYKQAMLNAKTMFNNTQGYVRSGVLMNAIYRRYDKATMSGYIGAKAPYSRIQEFGGVIVPRNAKHLWIKNYDAGSRFKRMTPTDFMTARNTDKASYPIFHDPHSGRLIAGLMELKGKKYGPAQVIALFTLVDKVTLPERPYIRPGVQMAYEQLATLLKKYITEGQP